MNTQFHGNLVVSPEMTKILSQPGFLSIAEGGQRLRELYRKNSETFSAQYLSEFGMLCYMGAYEHVRQIVE
ncbi:hypothetical protein APHAL10511_002396 [Amanita phalloides]|nr:hypothetical protein APHAL10511_002396 [Amanita phalloides]